MIKKILPLLIIGIFVLSSLNGISLTINSDTLVEKTSLESNGTNERYDLLIIAPALFTKPLQRFIEHKENHDISTKLVNLNEIYEGEYFEVDGRDPPEKIKYFIKNCMEEWNITYVLLVGGLKSKIYANPRENMSYGAKGWYVPVRYTNLYDEPEHPLCTVSEDRIYDPGCISDLYYADIYDSEGNFSCWDPNGDGVFAAWNYKFHETDDIIEDDEGISYYPDVIVSRLPVRSIRELNIVIDKIITYETTAYGQNWFKRMIAIAGDGFLDQEDLNFQWNTTGLSDGEYTIYAQSSVEEKYGQFTFGNIHKVTVELNRNKETQLHVSHEDHLQNPDFIYPWDFPIAQITVPSDENILGSDDFVDTSDDLAFGNEYSHWTDINFTDGIMHIRGKSYDPRPYGNLTNIQVWVVNETDEIIFSEWRNNTEMYYEGEWVTGTRVLNGRAGALSYMPDEYEKVKLWTSNGRLTGQQDVINEISKGAGFVFFSGHGSPNVWADHYPGVPGDRRHGSVDGLKVTSIRSWAPFIQRPVSPMNKLSNEDMLPIVVVGGCHNAQFNVSLIPSVTHGIYKIFFQAIEDRRNSLNERFPRLENWPQLIRSKDTMMWTYGSPVTECFNWKLISTPNGGAIATMGNTGLGYGRLGRDCTTDGGDGWITSEFFRQYGEFGNDTLGDVFINTQRSYMQEFGDQMDILEDGHAKTIQQWVLFGDPTLKIGGHIN